MPRVTSHDSPGRSVRSGSNEGQTLPASAPPIAAPSVRVATSRLPVDRACAKKRQERGGIVGGEHVVQSGVEFELASEREC